jgi:hypothetical protein
MALRANLKICSGRDRTMHCCPCISFLTLEIPHCLTLYRESAAVWKAGWVVICLHFDFHILSDGLLVGPRVLLHYIDYLLVWAKCTSLLFGLLQCFLCGNCSHSRIMWAHVASSFGWVEFLIQSSQLGEFQASIGFGQEQLTKILHSLQTYRWLPQRKRNVFCDFNTIVIELHRHLYNIHTYYILLQLWHYTQVIGVELTETTHAS